MSANHHQSFQLQREIPIFNFDEKSFWERAHNRSLDTLNVKVFQQKARTWKLCKHVSGFKYFAVKGKMFVKSKLWKNILFINSMFVNAMKTVKLLFCSNVNFVWHKLNFSEGKCIKCMAAMSWANKGKQIYGGLKLRHSKKLHSVTNKQKCPNTNTIKIGCANTNTETKKACCGNV